MRHNEDDRLLEKTPVTTDDLQVAEAVIIDFYRDVSDDFKYLADSLISSMLKERISQRSKKPSKGI